MKIESEVLIVGAGVAGLALALQLGRQGRKVAVVDKAALPRDKVCGEGLMPMGVSALARLGLPAESLPGIDFSGLEYRTARQRSVLRFAAGHSGRGIRRTALLEALQRNALAQPTVRLYADRIGAPLWTSEGGERRIAGARGLRAEYLAETVAAADGVHSALCRSAGLAQRYRGERLALRRHYRLKQADTGEGDPPLVRVGLLPPHDLYLTPTGAGELLATTMTDRAGFAAIAGDYDGFLRTSPFGGLFAGAQPTSALLRWHHPLFDRPCYQRAGLLAVGDAGGGVDPCLGLGASMALESAWMAGEAIAGMLDQPQRYEAWARSFDGKRRKMFRRLRYFDILFSFLVRSPAGSESLLWAMRHWDGTASALLDAVSTGGTWAGVPWRTLLEPLTGSQAEQAIWKGGRRCTPHPGGAESQPGTPRAGDTSTKGACSIESACSMAAIWQKPPDPNWPQRGSLQPRARRQ